jgi:DNA polymerase III alpha subunit
MARVHGESEAEINAITTKMEDKDEDGKPLTFDSALAMHADLRAYASTHPHVTNAAKRLLHRNQNMGKHAGGLIISSKPIGDLVPLVRGKDGTVQSAWVEGLHGQDLGPVGLIKYDCLSINNLKQISEIVRLIQERHPEIDYISNDPAVNEHWSDPSFINDPKAIEMANRGDLKCIFQFDVSPGIRKLAQGGVTSFDDLMAYSALWRPGPLGMKMQERYIERKKGNETYELHPVLQPILGMTYGVMVYQEQVMKILNAVGLIPLRDCEAVRKAISKKKIEKFAKYKDMFVENGQIILGQTKEYVENLWAQIESFAEYGFNKSHSCAYTYITSMLIYLKAHFPIEFYCGMMRHEEKTSKLKDYRADATKFGRNVEVLPINLNRSKETFTIDNDKIYYGLSSIKGIGSDIVKRIVAGQPYDGLRDFLERFGTDAKVCQPLIALGAFNEEDGIDDRIIHFKYYEYYKKQLESLKGRDKRFIDTSEDLRQELRDALDGVLSDSHIAKAGFYDDFYDICRSFLPPGKMKELDKLRDRYDKKVSTYEKKKENDGIPGIDEFNPDNVNVKEEWMELLNGPMADSEQRFYGFVWTHEIDRSPDHEESKTFEDFRQDVEQGYFAIPVEVKVLGVHEKVAKSGKPFYTINVEDSAGEVNGIRMWSEDWERFGEDIVEGNLLKIRLTPPDAPFPTFNFETPPRHQRWKLPKDKRDDVRVVVMRKPDSVNK